MPKPSYIRICTDVAIVSFQEGTEETLALRMSRSFRLLLATVRLLGTVWLLGQTLIRRGLMLALMLSTGIAPPSIDSYAPKKIMGITSLEHRVGAN